MDIDGMQGPPKNVATDCPDDELLPIKLCRNSGKDKLDLCDSQLQIMPIHIFELAHLQYLYLEGNLIEEIPSRLCETLTRLVWLDVRRNELKSLPVNILLLTKLKNLLLEGNRIEILPIQLGTLSNLSGLNLRHNPLKFPPRNIIAKGTKYILKYLREYSVQPEKIGLDNDNVVLKEVSNVNDSQSQLLANDDDDACKLRKSQTRTSDRHQYPVGYYADEIPDDRRRLSLEENMLQLLRYSVNTLEIKERKNSPKYSLPALRTKSLYLDPFNKRIHKPKELLPDDERRTSSKTTLRHQREASRSAMRRFNEKTDKTVQSRKNKKMLDDWRKRNISKSNSKPSDLKHEIVIPYGHDASSSHVIGNEKIDAPVKDTNSNSHPQMTRLSLDEQLESRIKEHVRNIKNWRRQHNQNLLSLEDQLSATSKNLEKAQQLQKELHEKRAKEYRFRAFTAGEFAPPAHRDMPVNEL